MRDGKVRESKSRESVYLMELKLIRSKEEKSR